MRIYKNLETYEAKKLFRTISRIEDFVDVTLDVTNSLMYWNGNPDNRIIPYICVEQDKFKRVFLVGQDKIISFAYTLNYKISTFDSKSPCIAFYDNKGVQISSKTLSDIRSIIIEMRQHKSDYLYVANDVDDDINPLNEESFRLFENILRTEPSYFRIDHDTKNPDTAQHPMNHIDVNFSNDFKFKLGLDRRIDLDEVIDILNVNPHCRKLVL